MLVGNEAEPRRRMSVLAVVLHITLIVSIVEGGIMLALPALISFLRTMSRTGFPSFVAFDPTSIIALALFNVILLAFVGSPLIYFWVIRPFIVACDDAEERFRQGQERFRDFAESTSDWFWETDAGLRFSRYAGRLKEVTGVDPKALLGKTRQELGKGDIDPEKWAQHLADLAARRPFRDFRYKFVAPDGRILHFSVDGKPVFDAAGRFRGYRGTGCDISAEAEAEERARSAQQQLAEAIDGLPEMVCLDDADDRLVTFNDGYRDVNATAPEGLAPGTPFEERIRAFLAAGLIPEAAGREEEWLRERLDRHRNPGTPFEMLRQDGRWMQIREHRLPNGGILLMASDITEQKRIEEALRRSEERLRGAVENLQEGFALYDADDRLVIFNDEYKRLQPGAEDILKPGMPFEALVRNNVDNSIVPQAFGREDEHLRERMVQHRDPTGPIVRELTNGTWYIIREARTPEGGIVVTETDITELKRAEKALCESEARFRAVIDNSPTKIHIKDLDGRYLLINRHSELLFGLTDAEARGKTSAEIFAADVAASFGSHDREVIECGHAVEREEVWPYEGCARTYLTVKFPIPGADGAIAAVGSIGTDITQHKATESQLRQAQKMESIGRLTGGVAHDFNNLLAVILGNLQLLERRLGDDERQIKRVQTAIHATQRGAELVKRLLAYSRQQVLAPKAVDANELVTGMTDLLNRALGETVDIELKLSDDVRPIYVDPGQLENALLNLAVNAHDAMPDGGSLVVKTANIDVDDQYANGHAGMKRGRYVLLTVSDTGTGIAPDVLKRVFEPFFTTKDVGKGTGLGLSMIYGFAKQSGAYVDIRSELGHGTAVELYLPVAEPAVSATTETVPIISGWPRGTEKILVVEDETGVRETTAALLKDLGYQVLQAANGPAALAILDEHRDIALLFTDVVMPGGMNGFELGREVRARFRGVAVLYTSGYTREALDGHGSLDEAAQVIGKPYRNEELARRIRGALDERMEMA